MNIVLIGDCQTGKSSYARRLTEDEFCESYIATIAKELFVYVHGDEIIYIHDCSGLDRYKDLNEMYYQNASGFIVMYTHTYPEHWIKRIPDGIPYVCVQNKSDIFESGDIRISCKNGLNITDPIDALYPKMEKVEVFGWYSWIEYLLSFIKF